MKSDDPVVTPTSVKIFALLMAVLGISTINSMLFEIDVMRRASWMQIAIATAWCICMIIAAIGLWKGASWGLRIYWLTYGLIIMQCIEAIIEAVLGGEDGLLAMLAVLGIGAVLLGLIGVGIKGSLVRQRSLDAPFENG